MEPLLQFFEWTDLPEEQKPIVKPFQKMASELVFNLPRNPERTVALRKLLEAKEAAVRAMLFKDISQ